MAKPLNDIDRVAGARLAKCTSMNHNRPGQWQLARCAPYKVGGWGWFTVLHREKIVPIPGRVKAVNVFGECCISSTWPERPD